MQALVCSIRGLHAHNDPQEILLELHDLEFPAQAIFRLYTAPTSRLPLPIVRLHLDKGEVADKIFSLTQLFGFHVHVELSRLSANLRSATGGRDSGTTPTSVAMFRPIYGAYVNISRDRPTLWRIRSRTAT